MIRLFSFIKTIIKKHHLKHDWHIVHIEQTCWDQEVHHPITFILLENGLHQRKMKYESVFRFLDYKIHPFYIQIIFPWLEGISLHQLKVKGHSLEMEKQVDKENNIVYLNFKKKN
jgi:hypothetical protein